MPVSHMSQDTGPSLKTDNGIDHFTGIILWGLGQAYMRIPYGPSYWLCTVQKTRAGASIGLTIRACTKAAPRVELCSVQVI